MFGDRFMGDFNTGRRFSELGPETNPFQCNNNTGTALDLCKKLSKMGIVCDMSIWSEPEPFRVDPGRFGSRATTLHGIGGASRSFDGFLHKGSPGELRFLALQDSPHPRGFKEMLPLNNHKRPPPSLSDVSAFQAPFMLHGNRQDTPVDAFVGSLMLEKKRISRAQPTMEASYPENLSMASGLPLALDFMLKIYGSVYSMAKDQVGCRVLQKLVEEGTFLDLKLIFSDIIGDVIELAMDAFGNYFIQKLVDVCTEEHRTLLVTVLTSRPTDLIKMCLNTYGTRVVQKMIETVNTKQQIELVKSGLKPGFLALVKDLNGNHVIQTCLFSFGPNDNKFLLEAATKYCAQIASHRHGCCVLQCCILNSVGPQRDRLVAEISRNSLHLSQDPFGNYVVQYIIEQKVAAVKLLMQLRTHYAELATQKFSSHVVEKCLRHYPESRAEIVRELLSVPNFEYLLQDPFANYVIQTALSVCKGAVRARLVERVYKFGRLSSSPYCKKIFSKTIMRN